MSLTLSEDITVYSATYTYFYWHCAVPMQVPCANAAKGATGECGRFCVSDISDTGEIETETWVLRLGWWMVVDGVDPCCKLPGWKSLKNSYLQQDLQINLCEELDKRVPVMSGASSSWKASEWIEVARKRSWTPSGRISGAVHIDHTLHIVTLLEHLECILLPAYFRNG